MFKKIKISDMGIALWGFVSMALFCGVKTAVIVYGAACLIGIAWGTYKYWKQRKDLYED